jgi:probable HAF family extracellular repeat protein
MEQTSSLDGYKAPRANHSHAKPLPCHVGRSARAGVRGLSTALILSAVIWASFATGPAKAQSVRKYQVTDLGMIAFELGNQLSRYITINNKGVVAGNYLPNPGIMHGFLWKNGHHIDIGCLPGFHSSRILGINDNEQVVGYCEDPVSGMPRMQAFTWSNGKMHPINITPPIDSITAVAINNKGQVLLRTRTDGYLWDNGKVTDLRVEGAIAVTNGDMILGTSGKYHIGGGVGYAYFCDKSKKPIDIGTLGGGWRSTAQGINERGQVVGYAGVNYHSRAFLWENNKLVDLSSQANSDNSVATAINNTGEIVGFAGGPGVYGAYSRAYIWQGGTGYNLNGYIPSNSGWVLISADAVNDHGQIVGFGHHNDKDRAFLLTPVGGTATVAQR